MELTLAHLIEKIEEEFDELPKGSLSPDGDFRKAMDWNSMNALLLMAMITTEFDLPIAADELRNCNTVRDIYTVLVAKIPS